MDVLSRLGLGVGLVLGCLFSGLGVVAVSMGVDEVGDASDLSERGRSASGTVVGHYERNAGPAGTQRWVIVRFTAADGTSHRMESISDEPVGAEVEVRYDPDDPAVAVTGTGSVTLHWVKAIAIILIGLCLIVLPPALPIKLALEARAERRRRSSPTRGA
ncbi:DUF3592 domain-containing protein [Spirillospora sp. CA-294931]|uniref:DUF3592 domain-containing protein n=1 Tax=Spirillospora sp. CA-294931 TaxID=3240042 RepID=UPI003D8DE32C